MTAAKLSLSDRLERFAYLQSVEMWLDPIPGKRRRAIIEELRANLEEAAADVGMTAAISDLGRPRALARQYLEQEPSRRPNWTTGAIAACVVITAWLFGTTSYAVGMLDAMLSTGAGGPADGNFLGVRVEAEASSDIIAASFAGVSWPVIVGLVLTFLLFSRAWRLIPRRVEEPSVD